MHKYIKLIKMNNLGTISQVKSFKELTTLHIGGKISLLFYPNSYESFLLFYKLYLLHKDFPIIIIGNGSNILASSNDYDGIVVSFKKIECKYIVMNDRIVTSSGVLIMDIISFLLRKGYGGFEDLAFIPATIGGMIKMNASAYNYEISKNLLYLKAINHLGEIEIVKKENIMFNYRSSSLNDLIIIEACFKIFKKDQEVINNRLKEIKKKRKTSQPISKYNAGSTFKNPKDYKAWELIDKCGLRGYYEGDAMISPIHTNFIINNHFASSNDVLKLINIVKKKVKTRFNIDLECEWIII